MDKITQTKQSVRSKALRFLGWWFGFYNDAATCVCDMRVASTGFTVDIAEGRGIKTIVGWGETATLSPMMPNAGKLCVKIIADIKDLRIVGANIISTFPATDKIDIITLAIQRKLTLKGLAKLSYSARPWHSFMPAQSAIVQASENAMDNFMAKNGGFRYPKNAGVCIKGKPAPIGVPGRQSWT